MMPHVNFLLLAAIVFGLATITAASFWLGFATVRTLRWWPLRPEQEDPHIHCRYCYFGRAFAREETVRVEDDDVVEVTCFVCRTCSLPQWRVRRSPVLKRAA